MRPRPLLRRSGLARRFLRREDGAGLVEYALVILLFLTLLFGIIDFGRLGFAVISANKANQIASRIAAVRPPVCPGVPRTNLRGTNAAATFGTLCRAGIGICASPEPPPCTVARNAPDLPQTAAEIFAAVAPLLPPQPADGEVGLQFTYSFDQNLGFLGGPFVPMVTVELVRVRDDRAPPDSIPFVFIAPLWGNLLNNTIPLPRMSVSVPGEDLAHGMGN